MEESGGRRRPNCRLPERLFAVGEEPTGVRVTPYHKAGAIRSILNALDPEEVEHIRASPFGRLVEIADKPSFSGRFGRYIISRQLKVSKKHEAWFLFAGKPIRFSIKEFALVTGLNCSKFPKRCKKKSKNFMEDVGEKPYWGELFGSLREVLDSSLVKMLGKKTVVDRETRLKYAYLSLLSSVILPTTHSHRISQEAAEMIKDLETFLAYPWEGDLCLLFQLVIVECVPALTEVVQDGSSSGSDGEGGGDDDTLESDKGGRKNISPGHARDTDAAGKTIVDSIMLDGNGETTLAPDFQWSDDEDDDGVSNMVGLIEERFGFSNDCFVGGATKEDVTRMRHESKAEMLNRKSVKFKTATSSQVQDGVDLDMLSSMVRDKLKEDFQLLHGSIANVQESSNGFTETIIVNINEVFEIVQDSARQIKTMSEDIRKLSATLHVSPVENLVRRPSMVNAATQTIPDSTSIIADAMLFANQSSTLPTAEVNISKANTFANRSSTLPTEDTNVAAEPTTSVNELSNNSGIEGGHVQQSTPRSQLTEKLNPPLTDKQPDSILDPSLVFPNPTFSLGLTQEARVDTSTITNVTEGNDEEVYEEDNVDATLGEAGNGCRKSKRQKVPTKSLMGDFECDKGFQNCARKAVADAIYRGGDVDYTAKFAGLMEKMKTSFEMSIGSANIQSSDLCDVIERATQLSPKVVDVLMFHTSAFFRSPSSQKQHSSSVFMDTQFVSQFTKLYTNFSKASKKVSYKFSGNVVDMFLQLPSTGDDVRYYFPFYLDKQYCLGICVDCSTWSVTILDCTVELRTDNMMNKEVRPLAVIFPYFLKQLGRQVGTRDCKEMAIEKPRNIPQQKEVTHSGVSSVLFIQAHAVGGFDACKFITPDVLDSMVEMLVVTLYEASVDPL
ncbi:hypothetical protein Rs2_02654 [Raphanus sativus]|uniref:Uncharacterized protein LOC108846451 n=1 Tax=Raphanus sativus TaxID=3726 RepID=A0A6J0MRT0_RAPSA|nr:uncharacterized protein LOC108846451 [Raphanus sativus]KAJ4917104.1 hypothetical protein Rs2_02654 [Raphanus sativus]